MKSAIAVAGSLIGLTLLYFFLVWRWRTRKLHRGKKQQRIYYRD